MDDKIALITTVKWEAEQLLGSLLARYPMDPVFVNFADIMCCIFRYDTSQGNWERGEASNIGEPSNVGDPRNDADGSYKMGEDCCKSTSGVICNDADSAVPEGGEIICTPVSQIWFSPELHEIADSAQASMKSGNLSSRRARDVHVIKMADMDLEASPIRSDFGTSNNNKGKAIMMDDSCPIPSPITVSSEVVKVETELPPQIQYRQSRRNVRIGEQLRSPYVKRIVDMKVTKEDRCIYEWARAALGDP